MVNYKAEGGFTIRYSPFTIYYFRRSENTVTVLSIDTIRRHLDQNRTLVDAELDRILPPAEDYPPSIHKAMRYSVFAGGKRLRPTLCLEAGRLFGGNESTLLRSPPATGSLSLPPNRHPPFHTKWAEAAFPRQTPNSASPYECSADNPPRAEGCDRVPHPPTAVLGRDTLANCVD